MQINRLGYKIVQNWKKVSRLTAHVFPIEGKRASRLSDLKAPSVRLRPVQNPYQRYEKESDRGRYFFEGQADERARAGLL